MEGEKADDSQFSIVKLFSDLKVSTSQYVFINWDRYDDIDEIGFNDFNMYFADIWYPGPDDIDIFDSSFGWIISISPEGYVRVVRNGEGGKS